MKRLLQMIQIEFQKYSRLLSCIAAMLSVLYWPRFLSPENLETLLQLGQKNIQLLMQALTAIALLFAWSILKIRALSARLKRAELRVALANLSPEEQADIAKQNIASQARFIARLFSSTKP